MPYDRRTRRSLSMFTGNMLFLVLPMAMGCQRLSVSRMPDVALSPAPPTPASPAPVPPPAATVQTPNPQPMVVSGTGSVPLTQLPSQPATAAAFPAPIPAAPAPLPATPMLDAALQRAKAADAAIVEEPPTTMPVSFQAGDRPRFTTAAASGTGSAPMPLSNGFLTEALPPVPPPADAPKIDPKVEATTVLVPKSAAPPRPLDPERPDPLRPEDVWREGLDRLLGIARNRAAESGSDTHDLWRMRAELLEALGEPGNAAASGDGSLPHAVLAALAALACPDSTSSPPAVLAAKVRTAVAALEDRSPLQITELQLCRKVKRFGDFEPLEPAACRAGRAVILYCEMAGVRYAPEGDVQRSRLASRVEIVAAGGSDPLWTHSLGTADDVCRQRRRDFYVNYRITLPDGLAPGSYELRLLQEDQVAGQTTSRGMALVIAP